METNSALIEELKKYNVDVDKLVVVGIGNEQIIGELHCTYDEPQVDLRSPKRFLRLQRVTQQGFSVDFLVADYDLTEDGDVVTFCFQTYYRLKNCSEKTQAKMYALILALYEQRKVQSAAKSGIVIPEMKTPTKLV